MRPARLLLLTVTSLAASVALTSCARPSPPAASPASSGASSPGAPSPATASPAAAPTTTTTETTSTTTIDVDAWSEAGFTNAVLALFKQRDPNGGWTSPGPLTLTARGFTLNLGRVWRSCAHTPEHCNDETSHFVDEAIKISSQQQAKPTPAEIFAIVRRKDYLDSIPSTARAATLFDSVAADLIAVYVVDQGGSVRGAQTDDLTAIGIDRAALPALVRLNLGKALPALPSGTTCQASSISVWATGNYYETSRLLLSEFWKDFAKRSHASVVVAVPAADALLVACDPTHTGLAKLASAASEITGRADRPVSQALLQWTAKGWQEVKP